MSFKKLNLSPVILKALEKCGYTQPTPIQEAAIPLALAGHDIIAKAPTGTGKTAAFILPALELLLAQKDRSRPRILVLTPTRELANQITDVIYKYGKELRVNATNILGGMPYREQLRKLSKPHDIIVATPGRLIDYMERGNIDFSNIKMVVLDEADRMLDMGFIDDVKYITQATPDERQTFLFTATMGSKLVKLAQQIMRSPKQLDISSAHVTLDNITQRVHVADDNQHKSRLLQHLLTTENIYKAIIFSATKRNADELAKGLRAVGHTASALHGDMNQRKRNSTITQFRNGKTQLLIATDVAARGIDVTDVSHVINYDLPKFAEDYVHRIGRTGRAGKTGIAVSLVLANDGSNLKRIERFTGHTIQCSIIPGLEPKKSLSVDKPGNKRGRNNKKRPSSHHKPRSSGNGNFARSSRSGEAKSPRSTEHKPHHSANTRSQRSADGRSHRSTEARSYKSADTRSDRATNTRSTRTLDTRRSPRTNDDRSPKSTEARSHKSVDTKFSTKPRRRARSFA